MAALGRESGRDILCFLLSALPLNDRQHMLRQIVCNVSVCGSLMVFLDVVAQVPQSAVLYGSNGREARGGVAPCACHGTRRCGLPRLLGVLALSLRVVCQPMLTYTTLEDAAPAQCQYCSPTKILHRLPCDGVLKRYTEKCFSPSQSPLPTVHPPTPAPLRALALAPLSRDVTSHHVTMCRRWMPTTWYSSSDSMQSSASNC